MVVFGWVVFPSKEIRDSANNKVPADSRMTELVAPLTDPGRLILTLKEWSMEDFNHLLCRREIKRNSKFRRLELISIKKDIVRILIGLVTCLLISSCMSTRQFALTDSSKEIIELPFKIEELKITDTRDTLLPMNWDVPMIAAKRRNWKGNPKFTESNRRDIENIIKRSEKIDGIPVYIEFKIVEGVCELYADWKSVKEYAKFKGELLIEIPSRNYMYKSNAEMYYENPTLNGTEFGTMKLYNQAVKNVTHMLLKQIRDEIQL